MIIFTIFPTWNIHVDSAEKEYLIRFNKIKTSNIPAIFAIKILLNRNIVSMI